MATSVFDTFINEFKFTVDTSQLKKAGRAVGGVKKKITGLEKTLDDLKKTAIGAFSAFFGFSLLKRSLDAFADESRAMAILSQEVKNAGGTLNVTADALGKFADNLERATGVDDVEIKQSIALLIGFGIKSKQVLESATKVIINTASTMTRSATQITRSIGEALADPAEGAQLLKRSFTQLSQSTLDQINVALRLNETSKAQQLIIDGLQKAYGGVAKAIGESAAGAIKKFNAQLGDLSKTIGEVIFEAIDPFIQGFIKIADFLNGKGKKSFKETIKIAGTLTAVIIGVTVAVGGLDTVLGILLSPVVLIGAAIAAVSLIVQDFITFLDGGTSALGALLKKLGLSKQQIEDVRKSFKLLGNIIDLLRNVAFKLLKASIKAIISVIKDAKAGIEDFIDGVKKAISEVEKLVDKVDNFFKRAKNNQKTLSALAIASPAVSSVNQIAANLGLPIIGGATTTNQAQTQNTTVNMQVSSPNADPLAVANEVLTQLGFINRNMAQNFDSRVKA